MIPNGKVSEYFDVTLRVIDPANPENNETHYPRIPAWNVLFKPNGMQTVMMHIENQTSKKHLTEEQKTLVHNLPEGGGLIVLDKNGHIPLKYVKPTTVSLYYEFDSVTDMLENNTFTEDDYGRLVMVKDSSGDPRIPPLLELNWVLYRIVDATNPHDINSYQRILQKRDMDAMIHWDHLDHGIQSTPEQIDKAVEDAHTHFSTIRELRDIENDLYYMGKKIVKRSEIQAVVVTTDPDLTDVFVNDMALLVTKIQEYIAYDESTIQHEIPFIVLEGNQDERYKNNFDIVHGPKLKTTRVTSMRSFFHGCASLEDYMWYDTHNCIDMSFMNKDTSKLKRIPDLMLDSVENFESFAENSGIETYGDIASDTMLNFKSAFKNAKKLYRIGLIKLPQVKDAQNAFMNCELLNFNGNIILPQVNNISHIMDNCSVITSLNRVEVPRCDNTSYAFANCSELRFISYLDMHYCSNATGMFENCPKLEYVKFAPKSLHTDISFAGTKLSIECLRQIIKDLDYDTPHQIDITGTPAWNKLTAEDETNIAITGWRLKY